MLLITLHSLDLLHLSRPRANIRAPKLPRRHLPLKQNIHLTICPVLRLWQSKIRPQKA